MQIVFFMLSPYDVSAKSRKAGQLSSIFQPLAPVGQLGVMRRPIPEMAQDVDVKQYPHVKPTVCYGK